MASIRINSRKVDAGNGRARHDFAGEFHSDKFGIVFSCNALILNLTDGVRAWSVIFDDGATAALAARFTERSGARDLLEAAQELLATHPAAYREPNAIDNRTDNAVKIARAAIAKHVGAV